MDDDHRPIASQAQVRAAITAMDAKERRRLYNFGKTLIATEVLGLDAKGLFHEAIARALKSRNWPLDVPIDVYLKGVMESVAEGERRKRAGRFDDLERAHPDGSDDDVGTMDTHASTTPSPDELVFVGEAERVVLAVLAKNKNAASVALARMNGLTAGEIQEAAGLNATDYETASKAIYRARNEIYVALGLKEEE